MSSQQGKLERLAAKRAAGKKSVVKVNGVPYDFIAVRWGGISPYVSLEIAGVVTTHTAAEWKRRGAAL